MDERGAFTLLDRKKDMIISGGFNVYPRAIEEAIHEHPSVAEAAVIGVPDPYRGQAAKAFVRLRESAAPFTLDELRGFLAETAWPARAAGGAGAPRGAAAHAGRKTCQAGA